jgi:hypothetical protein
LKFVSEFKRGYQPRTNSVKDENGDLLAESHNILNRWNFFCHLLNIHGINGFRQIGMHTAEPFVSECSSFNVEITIRKLQVSIRFQQN